MELSLLSFGEHGWGDEMLRGAVMTLVIASCSYIIGILLGGVFAWLRLSRFFIFRLISDIYTTIIRGIPELLIIYFVFYGGGTFLRYIASGLFGYEGYIDLPVFLIGIICIAMSVAAYSSEVIRGAINAVSKGQIEAAQAIAMTKKQVFLKVMLPQSLRIALPGLTNVWQLCLKDTSLISVIGLVEIMRQASIASGNTKQPFTFYFIAGLLFLIITSISNRGFLRLNTWVNKGIRTN